MAANRSGCLNDCLISAASASGEPRRSVVMITAQILGVGGSVVWFSAARAHSLRGRRTGPAGLRASSAENGLCGDGRVSHFGAPVPGWFSAGGHRSLRASGRLGTAARPPGIPAWQPVPSTGRLTCSGANAPARRGVLVRLGPVLNPRAVVSDQADTGPEFRTSG